MYVNYSTTMFFAMCPTSPGETPFMNYWLLKTEPTAYSFDDLLREGTTRWNGVSNPVALKNIRAMKKGDQVFIYHTGKEKRIVGIAEVVSDAYPDPKAKNLVVIDLKARAGVRTPVTLAAVKAKKEFADFLLVRLPRLSVMPVSAAQWKSLLAMSD